MNYKYSALAFASLLLMLPSNIYAAKKGKEKLPEKLEVSGDFTIPVTLNGKAVRLRVEPLYAPVRLLNPDIAADLGLKQSSLGFRSYVGPVVVKFDSRGVAVDYGAGPVKDRFFWADRPVSPMVQGIIAPGAMPYKIVRFNLHEAVAGEKEFTMPLNGIGFLGFSGGNSEITVDDQKIGIHFDLDREENLVTAPTGNLLAQTFSGNLTDERKETRIQYDIMRPVRKMILARPFEVSGLKISEVMVRVSDFGDATQIPEGKEVDESEIVVTGKSKNKAVHRLTLGRQFLSACSSLTYDFKAKLIRLSCKNG
jgi:hypothetical protein